MGKGSAKAAENGGTGGGGNARKLYREFTRAANSTGRDPWSLYFSPKKLAAAPETKAVLGAPVETQVEMVGLAAAEFARGGGRSSFAVDLLVNMLLRRALPLPADALAELLEAIVKGKAFKVSEAVVTNFLERWCKSSEMNARLVKAVRTYRDSLDREYHRKERQRLLSLIEGVGQEGTAAPVAGGGGKGGRLAHEPSRLDRVLADRGSLRAPTAPCLADRLLEALVLPAEDDDRGAARFDLAAVARAERSALEAVNSMLTAAPASIASDERAKALARDALPAVAKLGMRGAALAAGVVSALSRRQIKLDFGNRRAERFFQGAQAAVALHDLAIEARYKPDAGALAEYCEAMSRVRAFEYLYVETAPCVEFVLAHAPALLPKADDSLLLALLRFREHVARARDSQSRAPVAEFDKRLGISPGFPLELGERWSDRAYADLGAMKPDQREAWLALLRHCELASGGQPSGKWLKAAEELRGRIAPAVLERTLAEWFALVGKPRPAWPGGKIEGRDSSVPSDRAADVLKGLAWCAAALDSPRAAQALGDLAMACYKMVPGVGARCIKPGTAAVWALSQMTTPEALGQLSRVRQLVKFGTAKKVLDGALDKLARRLNMTTDELHEIAVPDFGLERGGVIREEAGDFTLELVIDGSETDLRVLDEKGQVRKTVPEAVKKEHKETLAALKQAGADIDKMLVAQKDRLERLYHDQRSWPVPVWRARYLDHPLVGALDGRLIWSFTREGRTTDALPMGGGFIDSRGRAFEPRDTDTVTLWHPVLADPSEVLAWRTLLEEHRVVQPFKQAHREIYVLTDAERRTRTYSNRFAAHIIKQAQFQALCQQRGWKHTLFVLEYGEPPVLHLPKWNLYAHYVVQPIGDDLYGTAGAYTYLQTDQVLFSRSPRSDDIPLEEVPALAFSEVMRDVDLFVSVTSVGNNPEWEDGGPEGRFRDYWWNCSFGALEESGKGRRDLLARLLPRLKIAGVCELEEKFLRVRGRLRTYRIHLGSGNILMEPNDEYLCIVPGSRAEMAGERVFLPFEGDRTLAIILSKAFMLAEDDKITDPSITRQIGRES